MTLLQTLGALTGITARRHAVLDRDLALNHEPKRRLILRFRLHGLNNDDWLNPPIRHEEDLQDVQSSKHKPLMRLNLHPLACYRALGLKHVVDHFVLLVANEGWDTLQLYNDAPPQLKKLGPLKQWGHIEHPAFWEEVSNMLDTHDIDRSCTQQLLSHAGWAGNTVPFEAVSKDQVELYAQQTQTCHPNVALWLQREGLWAHDKLVPSMGNWNGTFTLLGTNFLQWTCSSHYPAEYHSAVPIAYVQEWMQTMLAHYPLTLEEKVRMVGQACIAFDTNGWSNHFATACQPYLQGIDMPLLHAVCNTNLPSKNAAMPSMLEVTARSLSQDMAANSSTPSKLEGLPQEHKNLMLLNELHTPKNRYELYTLAVAAQKMDLGLNIAPETMALPDLN